MQSLNKRRFVILKVLIMAQNADYSARFYIRATKSQKADTVAPLRLRIYVAAQKGHLYLPTHLRTTPAVWSKFQSDGTPRIGADPQLLKKIDAIKAAIGLAINHAAIAGTLTDLTSVRLGQMVDAICRMDAESLPPVIGITPRALVICLQCDFCGDQCRAPWPWMQSEFTDEGWTRRATAERKENAPDFAAARGWCLMRIVAGAYCPTPSQEKDGQIIALWEMDTDNIDRAKDVARLLWAVKKADKTAAAIDAAMAEKGGDNEE